MRIVLISGFLNNHLLPICEELSTKSDFTFIATENRNYSVLENKNAIDKDYILHDYDPTEELKCIDIVKSANVVICAGSSSKYLRIRKQTNKLVYIYSERVFKRGTFRRFYPPTRKILKDTFIKDNDNLYVLCASSYLASDLSLLGFKKSKCFKFGYLPMIRQVPFNEIAKAKSYGNDNNLHLLFVGRLLKWKQLDLLLNMCSILEKNGIKYQFDIVGEGPEKEALIRTANKLRLFSVNFLGAKPIEIVYKQMLYSDILYLPSNKYEGWGAVVNEAMGCGCIVIETKSCGSARYMIQDGVNGYVSNESACALFECTMRYINANDKERMHLAAYNTVWKKWNAEIAAERLVKISSELLDCRPLTHYIEGPMSLDIL